MYVSHSQGIWDLDSWFPKFQHAAHIGTLKFSTDGVPKIHQGLLVSNGDVVPLPLKLSEKFGLKTGSYYGQRSSGHDKNEVLQSYTNAFELGVDQPDVETVVRFGVPPTMEKLVHEFGRAEGTEGNLKVSKYNQHTYRHRLRLWYMPLL